MIQLWVGGTFPRAESFLLRLAFVFVLMTFDLHFSAVVVWPYFRLESAIIISSTPENLFTIINDLVGVRRTWCITLWSSSSTLFVHWNSHKVGFIHSCSGAAWSLKRLTWEYADEIKGSSGVVSRYSIAAPCSGRELPDGAWLATDPSSYPLTLHCALVTNKTRNNK